MFGFLDFLSMAYNHDERMVDRYESDDLVIDTCFVTDGAHDYETAIRSPLYNNNKWVIVEAYDTKDEAQKGHDNWVDTMTNNPPDKLVECLNSEVSQWVGESEYKREDKE
jgi:hypothetical protein